MDRNADDCGRLLVLASSISDGTAIDWKDVGADVDEETTAVVTQLQIVEQIARLHGTPRGWDSLQIRDTLTRGSSSVVYRAFDPDLAREVALKVVRFGLDDRPGIERTFAEARVLTQVKHPHLVTVFRAERHGNEIGLWLELVDGTTLAGLVRQQGPLGARAAMLAGIDVCRALAAVHDAGLVHGHINAHHVMRDRSGRIVLIDVAAARNLARLDDHVANGSPSALFYMAPEVLQGAACTAASDIYGVGVLLYYLLTGTFPVQGTFTVEDRERRERQRTQKRLSDARPDVSMALTQAIERALDTHPDRRHASAAELEAALLAALPRTTRVLRGLAQRWPWRTES